MTLRNLLGLALHTNDHDHTQNVYFVGMDPSSHMTLNKPYFCSSVGEDGGTKISHGDALDSIL